MGFKYWKLFFFFFVFRFCLGRRVTSASRNSERRLGRREVSLKTSSCFSTLSLSLLSLSLVLLSSSFFSCFALWHRNESAASMIERKKTKSFASFFLFSFCCLIPDPWFPCERFNILGLLFQNIWVVAILLTGLAGGLAAKSYNDGATSFLQKPIK